MSGRRARGMHNYWATDARLLCARPNLRFEARRAGRQWKQMVKGASSRGIEVSSRVYTHTGEGITRTRSRARPRNPTSYRLTKAIARAYDVFTERQLAEHLQRSPEARHDSLVYWVIGEHVDGFRFDLPRRSRANGGRSTR